MYAWIWRHLPGNAAVKALVATALVAVTVLLLFTVVFPWIDPRLPFNNVTVDQNNPSGDTGTVTVG